MNKSDVEYMESGVWKCGKSPTGAHWWVAMTNTAKLIHNGFFRCKFCHDVKRFPTTWSNKRPPNLEKVV